MKWYSSESRRLGRNLVSADLIGTLSERASSLGVDARVHGGAERISTRIFKLLAVGAFAILASNISYAGDLVDLSPPLTLGPEAFESPTGGYHPLPIVRSPVQQQKGIAVPVQVDPLIQATRDEYDETRGLQQHNARVTNHYLSMLVTMGESGTEDVDSLEELRTEILAHARNLKEIKDRICSLRKQRGYINCQPVTLKIVRNPTYEVPKSQGTYQGGPIYVPPPTPSLSLGGCSYYSKIGGNACPVN